MPDIRLVAQAEDADAALDFLAGRCVELVILRLEVGNPKILETMGKMKALCPQIQVVALIEGEEIAQSAEASRADLVLRLGVQASVLKAEIEALVRSLGEEP
jgi:DNA-binding NarL/FixJ family response regulator